MNRGHELLDLPPSKKQTVRLCDWNGWHLDMHEMGSNMPVGILDAHD